MDGVGECPRTCPAPRPKPPTRADPASNACPVGLGSQQPPSHMPSTPCKTSPAPVGLLIPDFITPAFVKKQLAGKKDKCTANHGSPQATQRAHASFLRVCTAMGGNAAAMQSMERDAYDAIAAAISKEVIMSKDGILLLRSICDALGRCEPNDALRDNLKILNGLFPQPDKWETLFALYKTEWGGWGVENVGDMLSCSDMDVLGEMCASHRRDLDLVQLFDEASEY